MKTVAVFFHETDPAEYLSHKVDYFQAYADLSEEIRLAGGQMVIIGGQESYLGNGEFSHHWTYQNGHIVKGDFITADVVFNKSDFQTDGKIPVFNPDFISQMCNDKWLTYQTFSEISPKTLKVESETSLSSALHQISTDLVVCKPVDGSEGKNVYIVSKSELSEQPIQYPVLLQEFLDSSSGVPGVVDGLHDFRVAIVNGEIVYSYYRTPPKGSYLANVARGGSFEVVPLEKIPQAALDVVKQVDAIMARCPQRFYGVDMAFTPDGVKIIELNSRLGILPNRDHQVFHNLKKKLAQILVNYA